MKINRFQLPTLCAVTLLLGACASPMKYEAHRGELLAALEKTEAGEYEDAAIQMERLLVATENEHDTYVLQRFFGAYLLTRLNLAAAFRDPFLEGPQRDDPGFNLTGDASRAGLSAVR